MSTCQATNTANASARKNIAPRRVVMLSALIGIGMGVSGCNNAVEGAFSGASIGALAGLGLGSLTGNAGSGAAAGAILGGITGGMIGDQNYRRENYGGGYRQGHSGYRYDRHRGYNNNCPSGW